MSQFGQYDEPPATSPASTPRTRHPRLREALRATADIGQNELGTSNTSSPPPPPLPRTSLNRSMTPRRRQRSPPDVQRERPVSGQDTDDSRRRRSNNKRRRLDDEQSAVPEQPIRYGYYGQVEPGRLKLHMVSCDGGEHRDPRHPATSLGPHNVLKHDQTVYCSERQTANIVLRHADDTPFCLEKLHVVGPENGFTAPVRKGLIYVAMTLNDLRRYMDPPPHARRSTMFRRRRSFRSSPEPPSERLSLTEALRDPEVNSALRSAMDNRARDRRFFQSNAYANLGRSYEDEDEGSGQSDLEGNCEISPRDDTADDIVDPNPEDAFITLLSDEEPGPEENSSQDVIDFRMQRMHRMHRHYQFDPRTIESRWGRTTTTRGDDDTEWDSSQNLHSMMGRTRMMDSPQAEDSEEHPRGHESRRRTYPDLLTHSTLDTWNNDPNVTRARFFIRAEKHKVAVKFDPPVSGRFILLKLSADCSNVDVQSVIAKGYGGCRFFPAYDFR